MLLLSRAARVIASSLLLVVAVTPSSTGQCFVDDNLSNAPCWQPVPDQLPQFPGFSLPGLGICWKQCVPNQTEDTIVEFQTPVQLVCGQYSSQVRVRQAATGAPVLAGSAILDYSRTWIEIGPNNVENQVWRFVVKADLTQVSTPGTQPTCYAPLAAYPTNFFYGYVDYVRPCQSLAISDQVVVLWTGCDFLAHKPGISDFPGIALPAMSFAAVAPHTAANPFVPMNLPVPGGPAIDGAIRNVSTPLTPLCFARERTQQASLNPFAAGCLCPLSTVPQQHTLSVFNGVGSCPDATGQSSSWSSLSVAFPILPWPHMVQTSIGTWTSGANYPGPEAAWVNEGLFRTRDSCAPSDQFEVFYGATTTKGYPILSPFPVAGQTLTDMADNYTAPVAGPHPLPLLGSIRATDRIIYVTTP